ncbi:MAG: STAS domain-containing protein [Leptolyngbyaceae bacterium]|nr:STAS domain-containing protein [Leptolyngbyaceae bacterium]
MSHPVKIFQPTGILDGVSGSVLSRYISDAVTRQPATILIDLQKVTFINSSGLGALVSILKTIRSKDLRLCLCSLHGQVAMFFEQASLNQAFEIYSSQQEFNQHEFEKLFETSLAGEGDD